ncbi:SCO family protein [Thalassobacillus pellis]|uniref:SCO family protein n=1 Tax=Thalassobacillus pellis TaxID=748008 RepID=UPI001961BCCC|nr:SCO family protein [Thalassobacillus pellis]MBM7552948.1 protein SCO1/2 [Thalassobacillus pellis]
MKQLLKIATFSFVLLLLSACGQEIEGNMSRDVAKFTATNQHGEKVSLSDYKGKYWVANFIFTSCDTVCPSMTGNMARLQKMIKDEGIKDVQLVSFSVDPETDTPEKLKSFADKYNPDYKMWDFLTGYKFSEIRELSIKSFASLLEDIPDSDQMTHGTSFFLVTPEGKVIKSYKGIKASEMEVILEDLKKTQ